MKKIVAYLFFFILLFAAMAQQKTTKFSLLIPPATDSVQFARQQWTEGVNTANKNTAQAVSLLRNAARIFHKNNLAKEEGQCRMAIGDIYFKAEQYNISFGNYVAAEDIFYEISTRDRMYAELGVAKSQYHRGLYRFAIKNFAEVIEYSIRNHDDILKADATEYLGNIFFILQSNTESKNNFTSAFIANSKMKDDNGCLRIAGKLFTLHYQDRQFDSALWYSNYGMSLAIRLEQKTTRQTSHLNKIAALVRLGRLQEAEEELKQFAAEEISKSDLSTKILYEAISGNYYLALKQNEKARVAYDTAIRHASVTNTPDLEAVVYSNIAESYAEQNDYEKAYRYSLKYYDMMNNFYSNSISHLSKIESLVKEDVAESRIKYLSSINKIKQLQLLREMDSKQNLENENRLQDSILQKEKQLSIALGLESNYKSQQLQSQRQLSTTLNRESQSQKKQLQKEQALRAALLGGIVCLLLLGALAWYHYVRTKAKNKVIEKQSRELEILMKEIHHRVKNNLQIVTSLLDIQSLTLDNDSAVEAIRESKNRVQSMAIIHRFLYHENSVRAIRVEDYLKNLSENLFSSYNVNPDKIKLETDIDELDLDVDTMIPLGLILNELISNSLKYAFDGSGTLFISLKEKENGLCLFVKDNGKGFPQPVDLQNTQTFGLQLIAALAQKLKAKLDVYNDNGAVVSMNIKKFKRA
jgi:two-component sensor histidine kinase